MDLDVTTLALICTALLGAGYVLLSVLLFVPPLAKTAREAWPILMTETLIVGVAAGLIWIGGPLLAAGLLALAARCGYEGARVALGRPGAAFRLPLGIGLGLAAAGFLFSLMPMAWVSGLALAGMLGCALAMRLSRLDAAVRQALELTLFPAIAIVVFTAAGLKGQYGAWLLVAFILVETFDSYALLGGKLFGRTPAFPVLSPRKTREGLAIGAAMLMLTAAVAGPVLAGLPVLASAAVALLVGALTLTGDLAASRIKRKNGVKDYPRVLPYQGGLFDIVDAWVTAGAGLVVLVSLSGWT